LLYSRSLLHVPGVVFTLAAPRRHMLFIRVNGLITDWYYGDLPAEVRTGLDGIIQPKLKQPHDLQIVDLVISNLKSEHVPLADSIDPIAIIETPIGVRNLASICSFDTLPIASLSVLAISSST
jgi:citrate lyase beta subunit